MGRRHADMKFMPGFWVFPSGAVEPADAEDGADLRLDPETARSLARHAPPDRRGALVWAAIRETWEETGAFYGAPGAPARSRRQATPAHAAFEAQGLRPLAERLDFFARATTPPSSPIRFDSRFFLADGADLRGDPVSTGELEEVGWVRADMAAATFPMAHVTRFVLSRAVAIWAAGQNPGAPTPHQPKDRPIPRFTRVGDRFATIEDRPGDPPQWEADFVDR